MAPPPIPEPRAVAVATPAPRVQTLGEEIANSVTHGIGALLGVAALVALVVAASEDGDPWRITTTAIYGASLVALFLASTLYHAIPAPRWKVMLQAVDHAAIFFLIAGTYTPFALVTLGGPWGWTLFGAVWTLAGIGTILECCFLGRWPRLSTAAYLATGWVGVIAVVPLWNALPLEAWAWLIGGGLAYTVGVVFFVWEALPYHHTLWHLFVLAGAAAHFFAVKFHVLPLG